VDKRPGFPLCFNTAVSSVGTGKEILGAAQEPVQAIHQDCLGGKAVV
jgi:hypothetical protein